MEHQPRTPEEYPAPATNGSDPQAVPPESRPSGESAADPAEHAPDLAELTDMLFAFEGQLHLEGWDQPNRVFSLNHMSDEVIGVKPLLTPPPGVHAVTLMEWAAEDLQTEEGQQQLVEVLGSGYFGLVLAAEGWVRTGDDLAATDPTRSFADQPGSVECRLLHLRTAEGTELVIERIRGHEPRVQPAVIAGRVPDAMNELMDVIAVTLREAGQ